MLLKISNVSKSYGKTRALIDFKTVLTPGKHTIPAKIILRTLTDSWVHGTYTVEIEVK